MYTHAEVGGSGGWGGGRTSVWCLIQRTFVESAQNLTPDNLRAGAKPNT